MINDSPRAAALSIHYKLLILVYFGFRISNIIEHNFGFFLHLMLIYY